MKILVIILTVLCLIVLAQATLRLTINGTTSATPAITVNGKVYVPLEALQKAGMQVNRNGANLSLSFQAVAAGGANQRASLEGCLGEQLFNGVWRIRATKLERIRKDADTPGWGLTLEFRNGSRATITATDAGVDGTGQGIQLAFADATTLNVDPLDVQKLTFASLPQGGVVTHQLKFYYPLGTAADPIKTPTKFLLEVNPGGIGFTPSQQGVAFSVPNPSFRVKLDCTK